MNRLYPFLGILCLCAMACGGDGDEQVSIDGTWEVTELTCDGVTNAQIPALTLNVDDTVGSFVLGFGPECVATIEETYDYPDATTISITPTAINCEPNTGCAAVFGADCLPLPPATDFTYERNDNTLTFSKVSVGPPADNCAAGEQEVYTMTLQ